MELNTKNITRVLCITIIFSLVYITNLCAQKTGTTYQYLFEMVQRGEYDSAKSKLDHISVKNVEMDYTTQRSSSLSGKKPGIFAIFLLPVVIAEALAPKTSYHQITLMEQAVSYGGDRKEKVDFIEYLLKRGADPNKYYNGKSPIAIACEQNHTHTAKVLYNYGANPNHGFTSALNSVIQNNNRELLAFFMEKKVPFPESYYGSAPMASAMASGDLEMMDLILGADIKLGNSAQLIYKAAGIIASNKRKIDDSVYVKMIDKLMTKGFNPNEVDWSKNQALHYAFSEKCEGLAMALIPYTTDINRKNERGETALMLAVKNASNRSISKLVDAGADIYQTDEKGNTARSIAIDKNYYSIADELESTDPKMKERNNLLAYLFINDSIDATIKNDSAIKLIRDGISFHAVRIRAYMSKKHFYYSGPACFLHYAVRNNHFEIAEELLKKGADPNMKDLLDHDYPLEYVLSYGDTNMARLLLNYGADVHKPDIKSSIIFYDSYSGHTFDRLISVREMLKLELFKSIQVHRNENGWYYSTPSAPNLFSYYVDSASTFHPTGYAYIKRKDKWNIIDINGRTQIDDCDSLQGIQIIHTYNESKRVFVRAKNDGKWRLICLNYSTRGGKYDYDLLSPFQFADKHGEMYALCKKEGKYYFISINEYAYGYKFDQISVEKKGKILGTINGEKKRIKLKGDVPIEFLR